MIYLAIPYTFNAELSFKIANKIAAQLMNDGEIVFSPISHSHVISDELDPSLRYSQEFWLKQDLAFLAMCEKVVAVLIGDKGIELLAKSKGCTTELDYAKEYGIPVQFVKYHLDAD